jgi:hypothetical protein
MLVFSVLLASTMSAPVLATMIRGATVEQSIDASGQIVIGRVVGFRPLLDDDGRIETAVRVIVEENLKGHSRPGSTIEIIASGGDFDGRRLIVVGEADYMRGERVLLQLEEIDGALRTIGLAMGKWRVIGQPPGEAIVRDLSALTVAGSTPMTEGPIPLEDFRTLVARRNGRH